MTTPRYCLTGYPWISLFASLANKRQDRRMIRDFPRKGRPELAFALTMIAALIVTEALTLFAMPADAGRSVCRMQVSGPLAGTCDH